MTTQGIPRLGTVSTLRSPFGFVPTSELLARPTATLEFTIPRDTMRLSEARAWATAEALEWARTRSTVIVNPPEWDIDGMRISATVTVTTEPRIRREKRSLSERHDPAGCDMCEQILAYPREWIAADVATALGLSRSTVQRHRKSIDAKDGAK